MYTFSLELPNNAYNQSPVFKLCPLILRVYEWGGSSWKQVSDLLLYLGACGYPFVCGNYGICSNGQCSFPEADDTTNLFRQVDGRQPNLGCTAMTPISCNSS